MREETKNALEQILEAAAKSGDPNVGEACRVVRRDLLKGGREAVSPPVLFASEQEPLPVDSPAVVWKPKAKKR
jgi:hypothetical protein